jgi:hypothetical protein
MDKKTRATLDDIIKAKLQRDQDRLVLKDIEIPSMGKTLQFRRPTRTEICDFMDRITEENGQTEIMIATFEELIYACCEQLHDQNLFDQLEIEDPGEIVEAIMNDADILQVGDEVACLNPLYERYAEEEKNS